MNFISELSPDGRGKVSLFRLLLELAYGSSTCLTAFVSASHGGRQVSLLTIGQVLLYYTLTYCSYFFLWQQNGS